VGCCAPHAPQISDTEKDIHSPSRAASGICDISAGGSAVITSKRTGTDQGPSKFPELVLLDRWHVVGVFACMVSADGIRGLMAFSGLRRVDVLSPARHVHHQLLAHVFGSRRYETTDTSRQFWLALITRARAGTTTTPPPHEQRQPRLCVVGDRPHYYVLKGLEHWASSGT